MSQVILVSVSTVVVAAVTGDVDAASTEHFERELYDSTGGASSALVVDLRRVSSFDSTGLDVLVHLARRLADNGQQLHVVAREGSPTAQVFAIAGTESAVRVHPRVGAALAAAGVECDPRT